MTNKPDETKLRVKIIGFLENYKSNCNMWDNDLAATGLPDPSHDLVEKVLSLIHQERERCERKTVRDILMFLDELELQLEPQVEDDWKYWKYIRNSIVDRYKPGSRS